MKLSIIGAGNVGSSCAAIVTQMNSIDEIVLLDVKPGFAEAKAQDISELGVLLGSKTVVTGVTDKYECTKDSDVVVITSGIPRKDGMSRDDLLKTNAKIVKTVVKSVMKHSDPIIIVASNPVNSMTFIAQKFSKLGAFKVFGLAGLLDGTRFRREVANQLNCLVTEVEGTVIGEHGDTMVPILYPPKTMKEDVRSLTTAKTRSTGADLTRALGTSAYFGPGAALARMIQSIVKDENKVYSVCTYLEGEFGLSDVCLSVPCELGRDGINRIVEIKLSHEELRLLRKSSEKVSIQMKDALELLR
ncbi:malate dehydrogenase [Candidatus Dojkabacteria bacterium]|uniref:Malate dehydrogenase n=1 Tax=Candidatus Dojkabacteria bacterium TaxID=2099670 RepID=A0A955RK97_9BACT|nr:malate dehydrogenase [Candidatus Dojkabacteria bacterium]